MSDKKLKIYKETVNFIIQNEETKRRKFVGTEEADLIEALEAYPDIDDYEIEVDSSLWKVIITGLSKGK